MATAKTKTNDTTRESHKKPDWVAKSPRGNGEKSRLERVGAGWSREDGGICVRLIGKQVIDNDLYLYPISE